MKKSSSLRLGAVLYTEVNVHLPRPSLSCRDGCSKRVCRCGVQARTCFSEYLPRGKFGPMMSEQPWKTHVSNDGEQEQQTSDRTSTFIISTSSKFQYILTSLMHDWWCLSKKHYIYYDLLQTWQLLDDMMLFKDERIKLSTKSQRTKLNVVNCYHVEHWMNVLMMHECTWVLQRLLRNCPRRRMYSLSTTTTAIR